MTDLMTDIGLVTIRVYGYRAIRAAKSSTFLAFQGFTPHRDKEMGLGCQWWTLQDTACQFYRWQRNHDHHCFSCRHEEVMIFHPRRKGSKANRRVEKDARAWTGPPHCGWQVGLEPSSQFCTFYHLWFFWWSWLLSSHLLEADLNFKVTCRDNGKDDPPWKEWTKDGSATVETTFTLLLSLVFLIFWNRVRLLLW